MTDYNKYADVFLGCGDIDLPGSEGIAAAWHFIKGLCGNTHPGATLPFGRMSCCCYSGGYSAGYGVNRVNTGGKPGKLYDKNKCRGFSHLHLSGIGFIGKFYNYAVTSPFFGDIADAFLPRDIANERARPGYYAAGIVYPGGNIACEVTVTEHNALHRYRFGRDGGRIAVDFSNDGLYRESVNAYGLSARSRLHAVSDSEACAEVVMQGIELFICVICRGSARCGLWRENGGSCGDTLTLPRTEERFGAFFDIAGSEAEVTLCISAKSMDHARSCVLGETLNFDEAAAAAYYRWNAALGKIEIEADENVKRLFYSNLYHSFVKPSDRSGEGLFGSDGSFAVDYNTLWDQYKTQLPLVFTLFPDMRKKTLETFLAVGRRHGILPHNLMLDSNIGIEVQQARCLAQHVIADAYFRAARPGDRYADSIPVADLISASVRDIFRTGYEDFTQTGRCARATHQLDMAEACRSVAIMAREFGDAATADKLDALYENRWGCFDPDGLMRADSKYYEGNRWNYSFRLMHDMDARIALCGRGKAAAAAKFTEYLDRFFGFTDAGDTSARFEGYNNETDMESPYAYHFCGRRDRMCEVLRAGMKYMFTEGRGGIPGNNDSGGLSSCFVWNAVGIFPLSGQDKMLIGAPIIKKAVLHLESGDFAIFNEAGDVTRNAELNGKSLTDMTFSVRDMMQGGKLTVRS